MYLPPPVYMQPPAMPVREPSGRRFLKEFATLEACLDDMRAVGFEDTDLVVAVDYTQSNNMQGGTVGTLHHAEFRHNPYEQVMRAVGSALVQVLDGDQTVPCFGFGAKGSGIDPLDSFHIGTANNAGDLVRVYRGYMTRFEHKGLAMSGPTSFASVIQRVVELAKTKQRFHTLLIITDGQINDGQATMDAIVEASKYPVAIVIVGVGRGPWGVMQQLDSELPARRMDNVQFLEFAPFMGGAKLDLFATQALTEAPQLYAWLLKHGMFAADANTTSTEKRTSAIV